MHSAILVARLPESSAVECSRVNQTTTAVVVKGDLLPSARLRRPSLKPAQPHHHSRGKWNCQIATENNEACTAPISGSSSKESFFIQSSGPDRFLSVGKRANRSTTSLLHFVHISSHSCVRPSIYEIIKRSPALIEPCTTGSSLSDIRCFV